MANGTQNMTTDKARILSTSDGTDKFWRSDNSWSNILTGSLTVGSASSGALGIAQTNGTGLGISLYGGPKASNALEYGIAFMKTTNGGKYGDLMSDWGTYFTMNAYGQRGWAWKVYNSKTPANFAATLSSRGALCVKAVGSEQAYLAYPGGGQYDGAAMSTDGAFTTTSASATVTGALQIKLPINYASYMLSFDVRIYNYNTSTTVVYHIQGYPSSTNWHYYHAWSEGIDEAHNNLAVRFCGDGTNVSVCIGEVGTTWSYPKVAVTDVVYGHGGSKFDSMPVGWSINFLTTLPTTIHHTIYEPHFKTGSMLDMNRITTADSHTVISSISTWGHGKTGYGDAKLTDIWGQKWRANNSSWTYTPSGGSATQLSDTGDLMIFLSKSNTSNNVYANMVIDGNMYAATFVGALKGNADTATTLSTTGGTTANFWRGDNTWSNTLTGAIEAPILKLHQGTAADPSLSGNARIEFDYANGQPVVISYTPNDSYRSPAGLKVMGGSSATPAWFEVEGNLIVGKREVTSSPSSLTYSNRITIIPYFHTGGPWHIKSGDDANDAWLSIYYGSTQILRMKHDGTQALDWQGNATTATKATSDENGYNISNSYNKKYIQAIDLTGQDVNTWYPVTITLTQDGLNRIACVTELNSGHKPSWSTHNSGYTAVVEILAVANGWGTTGSYSICLCNDQLFIDDSTKPPIGYSQFGHSSRATFWCRGGAKYRLLSDFFDTWTVYTSSTTVANETIAPTTTYPGLSFTVSTITANIAGNAATASALAYPAQLTTTDDINGFNEASRFKVTTWTSNTTPGVGNGILISAGWTSASYGAQIAIDDDPTWYIALRQRNGDGWNAWKRIPMGDGTGASGTWDISVTGTATTASTLEAYASIGSSTTDHGVALKNWFTSNKSTAPRDKVISFYSSTSNNGSQYMGYFLSGYENNPYGGFFVCHYDNPYYVGISNGTYTQQHILTSTNYTSYTITKTGTGASGTWGISITGTAGGVAWGNVSDKPNICTTDTAQTISATKTFTAQILTSFKSSVAIGSYGSAQTTVANLIGEIRYSSGCMGSANLTVYTGTAGGKISAGWYNFIYSPHRTGGANGLASGDNHSYGSCILTGMTVGAEAWYIRVASNTIAESRRIWLAGNSVTNAVWNDLAECRKSEVHIPGYAITQAGKYTTKRLEPGCRITSDTWGFALGNEEDKDKMPVAISGRVLAYPYRPREEYHLGDCVCSAPDGKVDIMTRQEIRDWPDCIIGIVNEIPDYEEWGSDEEDNTGRKKIKVNGRIWIDVK